MGAGCQGGAHLLGSLLRALSHSPFLGKSCPLSSLLLSFWPFPPMRIKTFMFLYPAEQEEQSEGFWVGLLPGVCPCPSPIHPPTPLHPTDPHLMSPNSETSHSHPVPQFPL